MEVYCILSWLMHEITMAAKSTLGVPPELNRFVQTLVFLVGRAMLTNTTHVD